MWGASKKLVMPTRDKALPGRAERMPVPAAHYVNRHPLTPPFPTGLEQALFGLGCFWGAERKFWETPGVFTTAAGKAAGATPHPSSARANSAAPPAALVTTPSAGPQRTPPKPT